VDCNNAAPKEFNSSGTYIKTISTGNMQDPEQMAVDASGNLWVADWEEGSSHPVQEFNTTAPAMAS
jgi:DNA-binding beta-propeller fold protein YncE